jgi:hypothetical protein
MTQISRASFMKAEWCSKEKLANWRLEAGDTLKDAATVYILKFLAISNFDRVIAHISQYNFVFSKSKAEIL